MKIYAIGYINLKGVKELIDKADELGVNGLVDCRSKPYSRRYEFNRKRLEADFFGRYIWKGDVLGGLDGVVKKEGMDWLLEEAKSSTLMLLCMEASPLECHRYYDIGRKLEKHGVELLHVYDGRIIPQGEVEAQCKLKKGRLK